MRAKHNKKNSKNKEVENNVTTQYEEKYNDVILNDLVPEDRKEEFNIQEGKNKPRKKAKKNGFKFNVGKKSNKNNKYQQEQDGEIVNKNSKSKKNNDEVVEENNKLTEQKEQKKPKKTRPRQHHKNQEQPKVNQPEDKHGQKQNKKRVNKHRKQVQNKEEPINIQEVEESTLEENQVEDKDNITYRGEQVEEEVQQEMSEKSNAIWSDENFDKE